LQGIVTDETKAAVLERAAFAWGHIANKTTDAAMLERAANAVDQAAVAAPPPLTALEQLRAAGGGLGLENLITAAAKVQAAEPAAVDQAPMSSEEIALMTAAIQGSDMRAAIQEVKKAWGSLDAKGDNGHTALMNAVLAGKTVSIRQLTTAGASVFEKDAAGKTAVDLARGEGVPGGQAAPAQTIAALEKAAKTQGPIVMRAAAKALYDLPGVTTPEACRAYLERCIDVAACMVPKDDQQAAKIAAAKQALDGVGAAGPLKPVGEQLADQIKKSKVAEKITKGTKRNRLRAAGITMLVVVGVGVAIAAVTYGTACIFPALAQSLVSNAINLGVTTALKRLPTIIGSTLVTGAVAVGTLTMGALGGGLLGKNNILTTAQKERKGVDDLCADFSKDVLGGLQGKGV